MRGLPQGWADPGGGGETEALAQRNVPERISPTSSDTQGELVAEVTTGQLTLTPAGGPDEVLMTAAPVLGSALRQARRSPP